MEEMDKNILAHIGRYRLTTRVVLARFGNDASLVDAAIARLQRSGLLWTGHSLPGNRVIYQLTTKAAGLVGISEARARPLRPQSLFKHLGILLFCHVEGSRRYRLEENELREYLGDVLPDSTHCMGMDEYPILFSTYVPGQRTTLKSVVRWVREQHESAREVAAISQMLSDRRYGFAIVTDTHQRRKAILGMLHRPERDGRPPLARRLRILVEALSAFDQLVNGVSLSEVKLRKKKSNASKDEPFLIDAEVARDAADSPAHNSDPKPSRVKKTRSPIPPIGAE